MTTTVPLGTPNKSCLMFWRVFDSTRLVSPSQFGSFPGIHLMLRLISVYSVYTKHCKESFGKVEPNSEQGFISCWLFASTLPPLWHSWHIDVWMICSGVIPYLRASSSSSVFLRKYWAIRPRCEHTCSRSIGQWSSGLLPAWWKQRNV